MPIVGYNRESGVVVEVVSSATGALDFAENGVIDGGIVSAASAGDGVLYYIPASAPTLLRRRMLVSGVDDVAQDLVRPHVQVFFHRNKVVCIPAGSTGVAVFDPLCNVTEILSVPSRVVAAAPADHGFVYRDARGKVYGYDFNKGATEVAEGAKLGAFLGHYKRYAVAVLHGDPDRVVGITEGGAVVELEAPLPRAPFTSLDELVLHSEGSDIVTSGSCRSASPVGPLQLTSSQPTDSEVLCTICLCEFDGDDGITLDCGHYFHKDCIEQWVTNWMEFAAKGEHIIFTRAVCPGGCKYLVRHPLLAPSKRISELYAEVNAKKMALLPSFESTKTDEDLFYYLCGQCGAAFYGGERVCSRMQGREPSSSPQDLICDECLARNEGSGAVVAPVFKCRYCCNPATHRSFGTRYMCDACNARWDTSEPTALPCPGADRCPFGGAHPEAANGFLGCLLRLDASVVDRLFTRVRATSDEAGAEAE